jgi:hypothetical protein
MPNHADGDNIEGSHEDHVARIPLCLSMIALLPGATRVLFSFSLAE